MKPDAVSILMVEDEHQYSQVLSTRLKHAFKTSVKIESVETVKAACARLKKGGITVILLDVCLPDSNGLNTFERVHEAAKKTPIVILTGRDDATLGIEMVRRGAQDYLIKGELDGRSIARILQYAVERKRSEVAIREAEAKYRTIFENSAAAITVSDANERIISWNRFAEELLGMDRDDLY
jgi:two-component system, cell cycle sensor histidine kinase and response regulator CckA